MPNTRFGKVQFPHPCTIYTIYINDNRQTLCFYLALFAEDTSLYVTDRKEDFVVRKFQRDLNEMDTSCERWNIKINNDKTQGISFLAVVDHLSHILH
jgi:hypothetical protein